MTKITIKRILGASAIAMAASCASVATPLECANDKCDHLGVDAGPLTEQVSVDWCESSFDSCLYDSGAHQLANGLDVIPDPTEAADACLSTLADEAQTRFIDTCNWTNDDSDDAQPVPGCFVTGASAGEEPFVGKCIETSLCEAGGGVIAGGHCPSLTPADAGCCIGRPTPIDEWCESRFALCLYDSGAHLLDGLEVLPHPTQAAEACLTSVNSTALFERGESCDWSYDLDAAQGAAPSCFMPNAFPGERPVPGQCAIASQCQARELDELTSVYSGYCPGPDEVKCCVGLDDFEEGFSWPR